MSFQFRLLPLQLPTPDFDLNSLCVDTTKFITTKLSLTVSIPLPDAVARTLLPSNLVLQDTVLTLVFTPSTKAVKITATADWKVGQSTMNLKADFNTASGSAVISGATPSGVGLSVADLFSLISKGAENSLGLQAARADAVSFQITFQRRKPLVFFVRLLINSAKDLALNLLGAAGLPSGDIRQVLVSSGLNNFDIKNVEILITNELGNLTVRVNGQPVLPRLPDLNINVQIELFDLFNLRISPPQFGFSVSSKLTILHYSLKIYISRTQRKQLYGKFLKFGMLNF